VTIRAAPSRLSTAAGAAVEGAAPELRWSWTLSGSQNFEAVAVEGSPAALHLHLDLILHLVVPSSPVDFKAVDVGPFTFDFAAPFLPAVVVTPEQTVVAQGVPVTLAQVSITPSSTLARLCFDAARDPDWLPIAALDTGAETVNDLGFLEIAPRRLVIDGQPCVEMDFLVPYHHQAARWTLVIDRLQGADPVIGPWTFTLDVPGEK